MNILHLFTHLSFLRYRKMKERLGMTEMRRQANRMTFGDIEDDAYQEDLGLSLGALGKSSGKVRGPVVDSKTKLKISKTLQVCARIYTV
jgi:U4/U6 small nuclear ribonucleoprotein PRP31